MSEHASEKDALTKEVESWGYFTAGIAARKGLLQGRRVLDVGMGGGPWSVAAVEKADAAYYVGVDPNVGTNHVRDFRSLKDPSVPAYHPFPYSAEDIQRLYANIKLYPGTLESDVKRLQGHKLDLAVLSSVTEHLQDPLSVFTSMWDVLERDALLWVSHSNYYSWSGHHLNPRRVQDWNKDDAKQSEVVDWKHLEPSHPVYSSSSLNRVRLRDMREIISNFFEIVDWSPTVDGITRLSPELRKKYKKYTVGEMVFQTVHIIGKRRSKPLKTKFTGRQFYHPDESYLNAEDHSKDDIRKYELIHHVYFGADGRMHSHSDNEYAGQKVISDLRAGQKITVRKGVNVLKLTVERIDRPEGGSIGAAFKETLDERYRTYDRDSWRVELDNFKMEG